MSKRTTSTAIADLSYEQARDELGLIVTQLESGGLSLEESLALWERGEALAEHCQSWLDAARSRLDDAPAGDGSAGDGPTGDDPTGDDQVS